MALLLSPTCSLVTDTCRIHAVCQVVWGSHVMGAAAVLLWCMMLSLVPVGGGVTVQACCLVLNAKVLSASCTSVNQV
jgi:hypothetical protein